MAFGVCCIYQQLICVGLNVAFVFFFIFFMFVILMYISSVFEYVVCTAFGARCIDEQFLCIGFDVSFA